VSGAGFGPHIVLGVLYEKKSARGSTYFVGRLGRAKIAVLRSREVSESGDPVWEMRLEQAPDRPLKLAAAATEANSLFKPPARQLRKRSTGGAALPDLPDDRVDDVYCDGGMAEP
jgi:hypothetical protein